MCMLRLDRNTSTAKWFRGEEDYYDLCNNFKGSGAESLKRAKVAFVQWHEEEKKTYTPYTAQRWIYEDELLDYCFRDCEVLAAGLKIYRDL